MLKEIADAEGEVITFIDEMHTVVGAGAAEGAMDAGNMIKPMLARGELRMIGATTLDEFRKHVEKDPALERRFQQVFVGQPSVEATVAILRGLKERYEVHHGVRIQDAALVAAAVLSDRYITGRFLPDKAIDLIDEAASRLRIEIDSMPTEIDVVERRMRQLEIEKVALANETDPASRERLERLEAELANLGESAAAMKAHWSAEKEAIATIRALKEQLETRRADAERFERDGDLTRAAEIRYGELPELERQVEQATATGRAAADAEDAQGGGRRGGRGRGREQVDRRAREPADGRRDGQAGAHGGGPPPAGGGPGRRRARGGRRHPALPGRALDPHRPIGSVPVPRAHRRGQDRAGPGAGRVPLRRRARHDPHRHGGVPGAPHRRPPDRSPAGLRRLRRGRPAHRGDTAPALRAVVLLDEIEKAHPDVFNTLLQVLDDGRLTDGQGRTVDFTNTVLVMTSNLPGDPRDFFKPEFVNRIDEIIRFRALTEDDLAAVVTIQLEHLRNRLAARRLVLEVSDDAVAWLARRGYDPDFGARPLKRLIQRAIGDPLALALLEVATKRATP